MIALAKYREKNNMTQLELAKVLNVTQGAVANWEIGFRTPSIKMLKKIASVFDCTTDELLETIA